MSSSPPRCPLINSSPFPCPRPSALPSHPFPSPPSPALASPRPPLPHPFSLSLPHPEEQLSQDAACWPHVHPGAVVPSSKQQFWRPIPPAGQPVTTRQCWEAFTGLAEPIDDRSHNLFMGRHFENYWTRTVGRGHVISHHSIMDIDLSTIATKCNNILNAKHKVFSLKNNFFYNY